MKTFLTTLFMICFFTTQIFSQWDWLNPAPHGNANNRIAFGSNSNTYTIVGNAGIIMKTTNDGTDWTLQNSGTHANLYDIFTSNSEGIAVGDGGSILGTTNGGGTWGLLNSGTTTNLTAVTFSSLSNGVIIGWNGLILHTTNTGVDWDSVATPTTQKLYGVSFADANNGLAVGAGVILKTTDGGATWNSPTSGTIPSLNDVSYVSSTTAVASGYNGSIIRTTNGGSTWNSIGSSTYSQWGVAFTSANNGVVVGDWNTIAHTTDGGTTWTYPSTSLLGTNFNCVRFFNLTKGVAVGEYGAIFKTLDGGITWEIVTKGIQDLQTFPGYVDREYFYDVQCLSSTTAVILRTNGVYFTSNSAQTWTFSTVSALGYQNLNGLHFINSNTGTVVGGITSAGENAIVKTTDAGANWITQYSNTLLSYGKLNAVSFSSPNNGIVVGDYGRMLRTTNGGQNWIEQLHTHNIYDVHLVDLNIGYAVGSYGSILKTTDGGATWTSQRTNASQRLYGVDFKDANNGIAVGILTVIGVDSGLILRTTNGGAVWTPQTLGSPIFLKDVTYTDNNNWYAVGTSAFVSVFNRTYTRGRIFKSQDAGITWSEQLIPFKSTRIMNAIAAFDNNSLLAVGSAGMVLGTTNGGGTQSPPPNTALTMNTPAGSLVLEVAGTNGFSIGDNIVINPGGLTEETNTITGFGSMLLQTALQYEHFSGEQILALVSTSVEEIITDFIPETFILEQNYPNPFNPSTKIRFAIPNVTLDMSSRAETRDEGSRVQLNIYDILGNEVATLVDGFLPTGTYEVEWNAVNVASGVYFYSIKAGEYLETKKMILLK